MHVCEGVDATDTAFETHKRMIVIYSLINILINLHLNLIF